MPVASVLAAPGELYHDHVRQCLAKWHELARRLTPTLRRLFSSAKAPLSDSEIACAVELMILCHDIGKLTRPWQERIHKPEGARGRFGPPHATLGGAYLLSISESDIFKAAALAVLMHHVDSGLANANLEYPAEDAINKGLTRGGTENIRWADGAQQAFDNAKAHLDAPLASRASKPLTEITINGLEEMATTLRQWSRCANELQRHARRLQALALHHILKVCDWRAASQRDGLEEGDEGDEAARHTVLEVFATGGLLP